MEEEEEEGELLFEELSNHPLSLLSVSPVQDSRGCLAWRCGRVREVVASLPLGCWPGKPALVL